MANIIKLVEPFIPEVNLDDIYQSKFLTNNGTFLKRLESVLSDIFTCQNLFTTNSGTSALFTVLKNAIPKNSKVVTSPYTFPATYNAIIEAGHQILYTEWDEWGMMSLSSLQNILREYENIGAILIPNLNANTVDIDRLHELLKIYPSTKLIFDNAQAFSTKYKEKYLWEYADYSCYSLHSTKIVNSIEGGFVISKQHNELFEQMKSYRNFGFNEKHGNFNNRGLNFKLSEIHALWGIKCLENLSKIESNLLTLEKSYDNALEEVYQRSNNVTNGLVNQYWIKTSSKRAESLINTYGTNMFRVIEEQLPKQYRQKKYNKVFIRIPFGLHITNESKQFLFSILSHT